MARGKTMAPEEIEYIRQNCLVKSDEELAEHLNRDIRTIASARKKLGITKTTGGRVQNLNLGNPSGFSITPSQRMTEEQRKEFFKTQLTNSLYYQNLKEQFIKDEIDFYLEEWASLCVQFEDIVATEKRQIDELIKAEILGNRILRNIKVAEEEIEKLIKEVEELYATHDMENDEEAQERDIKIQMMIRSMSSQSQAMSNDYQKNVDLKNKLLNELNARRRDRIDQISKRGTTFLGIVESLRDRETRETQGRHMELVRIAKQKKISEWRKANLFPDGSKDCVLMDEGSEIPKREIVRLEESNSQVVEDFSKESKKEILVIDDDSRRIQFFQSVFPNHKIEVASNVDKAVAKLDEKTYDLICLDYDLGLNQKGDEVANYILRQDMQKDGKILVHSMNKTGSQEIRTILAGKRNIEVCPFENIVKTFGDKNA